MSKNTMRNRIINCLELLKKEVDKRDIVYEHGVDLINYENYYTKTALDLIAFNLFLMNKKNEKSEEQIRSDIDWWLYEDVEKKIWINKKEYNVEKAKNFVKFILEK